MINMQHRWREDLLDERQRQVDHLHECIRNYRATEEQDLLYRSTMRDIKHNVETRFRLCEESKAYHFPKQKESTPSQAYSSLHESNYNLFEQNQQGKLYDQVLYPSRKELDFLPDFSKKVKTSLEKSKARKSRQRIVSQNKSKSKEPRPRLKDKIDRRASNSKNKSASKQKATKLVRKSKEPQKRLMQQSLERTLKFQEFWSSKTKKKTQCQSPTKSPRNKRAGTVTAMGSQSMSRKKITSERRFCPERQFH